MNATRSTPEIWKPVIGYEGLYEVSDHGRVRSSDRNLIRKDGRRYRRLGRILVPSDTHGYSQVSLSRESIKKNFRVHRLVLEAFVGPRSEGTECCHYDGNKKNNAVENLRWDTARGNYDDRLRVGKDYAKNKTHCPRGHELSGRNLIPLKLRLGHRECLACSRASGYVQHRGSLKGKKKEIADSYYEEILKEYSAKL